jgi:RHS repeat-associated protein
VPIITGKGCTARQYDALNRLTVNSQGNKRVDYGYNAIGQVTNKKRFSDTTGTNLVAETNHTFDSINRLTGITHSKGTTNIATYTQSYDANSRITDITNKDGTAAYNYDETDQLTGADFSFQTDEDYTYDNNGNRTNSGYVTGTNNRLLEDAKYRYDYDLVGNRTKRTDKTTSEVTEYAWDIRDRLTGITVKNVGGTVIKSASYKYDVFDQRISKTADLDGAGVLAATTERYVYGSNQNIALEFDGNNNLTHRYLFGDGIDQIEADDSNGTFLWGLVDHLGSVRDVIDNSGSVRNHISYDSFGNITAQTDSSVVFRYRYTGREFDKESGQYYYRSRYFDPSVGKFISEDRIGFAGGDLNLSRYVWNSPILRTDPSGKAGEILTFSSGANFIEAKVGFTPTQVSARALEPRGGVVTKELLKTKLGKVILATPKEDQGHLLPELLGGSDYAKMSNSQDNFISQNRKVNRGAYRLFGERVSERLEQYYYNYLDECYARAKKRICTCLPYPRDPDEPYLNYRVDLQSPSLGTAEAKFPERPEEFTVTATFHKPTVLKGYAPGYASLPNLVSTRVKFTNYLEFSGTSSSGYSSKPNYYTFFSNDAKIRTNTSIGSKNPIPIDPKVGF